MKLNIFFAILLLSTAFSCEKKLDLVPTDFLAPANYYETRVQMEAALAGVYDALLNRFTYSEEYQYAFTSGTDENATNQRINNFDIPAHYNATSASVYIGGFWQQLYVGVNRANLLLQNIDKPTDLTAEQRNFIRGEAMFLRAYYYFMLTQWFGDVPLSTTPTTSLQTAQLARTPSIQVYDFIIKEMTTADSLLANQKATAFAYSEKVTQTVVEGMLARVCLYAAGHPVNDTKRYLEAAQWATKVMSSGLHSLNPDFQQVFINHTADQYDNMHRESMWEVGATFLPGATQLREGSHTRVGISNALSINNLYGRSYGWDRATARLYYTYENGDLRRDWSISPFTYTGGTLSTAPTENYYAATATKWARFPGKWRRQYEIARPADNNISPKNIPVLRYADVLLMFAEAENEVNGPTPAAIEAVNLVRRRAFGITKGSKGISNIVIDNGGTGYSSTAPTITFTGGTRVVRPAGPYGTVANAEPRAVVTVSVGAITSVTIVTTGDGYTTAPTVTLSGTNTSAKLTAVLATSADLKPAEYASKELFRKLIQDERMRELSFEYLRRQDLKRWNLLQEKVLQLADEAVNGSQTQLPDGTQLFPAAATGDRPQYVTGATYYSPKWVYFPIPIQEIVNNKLATQNEGF